MPFSFHGIDHIQLAAPKGCESEARHFFSNILMWQEIPKPEALQKNGGVWFRCGAHQVHIGVDPHFTPAKKAHPAFYVQNLEDLREHIVANGYTVQEDALLPGAERFYVMDPFGNRLEFLEWMHTENHVR
ncbi:glyoxalase [Sulfoacidibacillus thermotolerans]|uniref:Glyoxalase n=1 Tax=Sulfoacidibacillus thermotolerans TaxID=1765684 RepID=A0A2U3D614_SULT2|nr:glyoxalase [Sulfoacidibacillus thermotolerans]PWI56710.1 glyoxalase [Sulfoacidibacillus thermotolerans]